ncbi:MAG: hypothetical protein ABIM89_14400 [Mycobacteriales bacterium]
MTGRQHERTYTDTARDGAPSAGSAPVGRAPWWRHVAVILVLAALTRVGFYFAGLVAALIMLTDLRRHPYTRLGSSLVLVWWTFVWGRASVPPLIGLGLLGCAAAAYAVAATQQRERRASLARNVVYASVAAALALLNVLPYGLRGPSLDKQAALSRALAASRSEIDATHAQVVRTRERFNQRPLFLVLLFEPNANAATTGDGEPCFQREEVHIVDGLSGDVDQRGFVDRLMLAPSRYQRATAREKDGNCLPLPRGTRRDVVPIQGR